MLWEAVGYSVCNTAEMLSRKLPVCWKGNSMCAVNVVSELADRVLGFVTEHCRYNCRCAYECNSQWHIITFDFNCLPVDFLVVYCSFCSLM